MTKIAEPSFQGHRLLVVEDEYFLAQEVCEGLKDMGAEIVGPAGSVDDALALIEGGTLHGAVLDVNLGGEPVFPVADRLAERGVPFLFTTGYDASAIPDRFGAVVRCEKPVDVDRVVRAIGKVLA